MSVGNHIAKYITFIAVFWAIIVTNRNSGQLGVTLCHAEEKTIYVVVDKVEMVRPDQTPSVVQIGNPEIADVNIASDRSILVLGISTGETSLLLLDTAGNVITNMDVIVIPKTKRRVTVHQGTSATKSLDCGPKCVEVTGVKDEAAVIPSAVP